MKKSFNSIIFGNVLLLVSLSNAEQLGRCLSGWEDVPPHGCFYIDKTNLRDFFMTYEFCKDKGGYMVEFFTQVYDVNVRKEPLTHKMLRRLRKPYMTMLVTLCMEYSWDCSETLTRLPGLGFTAIWWLMRPTGTLAILGRTHTGVQCSY